MSNTIKINGVSITAGRSITVTNGRVVIDGKDITPDAKEIKIEVSGNVERLDVDVCDTIAVAGSVGSITTQSGDVDCGSVSGDVKTMSGDVECGDIGGSAQTMSGDIRAGMIAGGADSLSGRVRGT